MTQGLIATGLPKASRAEWLARVAAVLDGAAFDTLIATTADRIRIEPLYDRPTEFSRVGRAEQNRAWTIAQRIDHEDTEVANHQARTDLENGAEGLTLVFASSASARGFGLSEQAESLARALAAIELSRIVIRLDAGAAALSLATSFCDLVRQRNADPTRIAVDFGVDPVGVLAASGYAFGDERERGLADLVLSARQLGLSGSCFLADGRCYHEAGASEAQELGLVLATGVEYLRRMEANGLTLEAARDQVAFLLTADADESLTIAKFRALRVLWAHIQSACGLAPKSARVHAETAYRMMTERGVWVNVMRTTVAAFAAGLGGADVVTLLPFTAAVGLADETARRLARNTQLILLEEAHLAKVADPTSGSGAFETLTTALSEKAWAVFEAIERLGSVSAGLRAGHIQSEIAAMRERRHKALAQRDPPITGTSDFPDLHETAATILQRPRFRTDIADCRNQICAPLPSERDAEPFERLRDAADAAARSGKRPAIFLACFGPLAASIGRASFVKNLFEAAGIAVVGGDGGDTAMAVVERYTQSATALVCVCASDADYAKIGTAAITALKAAGAQHIYLAGRPNRLATGLANAGVDTFLTADSDALSILRQAHTMLGRKDVAQ
jgi:methylmalonyl-CoA mutase